MALSFLGGAKKVLFAEGAYYSTNYTYCNLSEYCCLLAFILAGILFSNCLPAFACWAG